MGNAPDIRAMPSPSSTPQHLDEVDEALLRNSQAIDAAIDAVLDQQVTDYPILVWQRDADLEIGVLLIADAQPGAWDICVTSLEELSQKHLIRQERIADFRKVFTDARRRYCLFVIDGTDAQFAFRPRS